MEGHAAPGARVRPGRAVLLACALLAAGLGPPPVRAWKVRTHAHLAFAAREDALDDGRVTIVLVDPDRGTPALDARGRPAEIGRYEVDPRVLRVLRDEAVHFRAGVVGTDVLPDLITAQSIVHPDNSPLGRTVSDRWLDAVWTGARRAGSDRALSFALGYLAHAAGDLFGHTFVNAYAGGPFAPGRNALKHFVLENYIDLHTPAGDGFYDVSIDGLEPLLHRLLVVSPDVWRPGADTLLEKRIMNAAPPRLFASLRESLLGIVAATRAGVRKADREVPPRVRALAREAAACAISDPVRSARLTAEAAALSSEHAAMKAAAAAGIAYLDAWVRDIDAGLRAWPAFGVAIARTVLFTADPDRAAATSAAEDFMHAHGLSMVGLPDLVGETLALQKKYYEMLPPAVRAGIELLRTDLLLYLVEQAWGVTWDLIREPAVHFDEIMNAPPGRTVTWRRLNREELHIADMSQLSRAPYDWTAVPAMVNTVTLTKLQWLSPGGLGALLRDLEDKGYASNTPRPLWDPLPGAGVPTILGFMSSLDEDNEWNRPPRLLFARDPCVYRRMFLRQTGEDGGLGACDTPPDGSVVAVPVESALAAGFAGFDLGRRPDGTVIGWGREFVVTTAGGTRAERDWTPPAPMPGLPPAAGAALGGPEDRVVVLGRDGSVWTWGFGAHEAAGMTDVPDALRPAAVPNLVSMVQVAAGVHHVLALRSNGQVWGWGDASRGQLGVSVQPARPRRVPGIGGVARIAAGDWFSAALDSAGRAWTWGANDFGQLGDGRRADRAAPAPVPGFTDGAGIACGYAHVLALDRHGAVWTWGKNDQGQLGTGSTSAAPGPNRVAGLGHVTAVAAGGNQSIALDADGAVWAWGDHGTDQAPPGGRARRSPVPFRLIGLPPGTAVACGASHALVLGRDGSVWTWGTEARTPVRVRGADLR